MNPEDPVVITSIANLRFRKGQIEDAITLYERAAVLIDSAVVMFDLAQAYARSFQMERFEGAMSKAQSIDADEVVLLSRSGDQNFLANLALPGKEVRDRMLHRARGDAFVQPVRRAIMPGQLGRSWLVTAGGFVLAALLSLLVSGRYEHSSTCGRCGRRICNRCDGTVWNSEICEGCHHLFHRPQATEPELRMARLAELRERETRLEKVVLVASLLVPGVAGLLARRPGLSFVGLLLFVWAVVAFTWRQGVVPDPLTLGSAGPLAFLLTGVVAVLGYLGVLAIGLAVQRSL
jgi:ribosomal protein L37AE/L43A